MTSTDRTVDPTTDPTDADTTANATADTPPEDAETFPRAYVEKLRSEAAAHRQRAAKADRYARKLHAALVAATGRLADSSDLTFDEVHLDDEQALTGAIEELLRRKPHLASRRVVGDVGQGASRDADTVDLAGVLRRNAS